MWKNGAQFAVERLVEKGGASDGAAGFCQWKVVMGETERLREAQSDRRQLGGGIAEQGLSERVAGVGGGGDHGKNARVHFVGVAGDAGVRIMPVGTAEVTQDLARKLQRFIAVWLLAHGNNGGAANVEGAAFVAAGGTIAAFAQLFASRISADGGGASANDEDDGGAVRHGGKREVEIGTEIYRNARKSFLKQAQHALAIFRLGGSREAGAEGGDFARLREGGKGVLSGLSHASGGQLKTDARGIRGGPAAAGQNVAGEVHSDAFGLGTAAIKAQDTTHTFSLRELRWNSRICAYGKTVSHGQSSVCGRAQGLEIKPAAA